MNFVSPLAFRHTRRARVLLLFAVAFAILWHVSILRMAEISTGFRSSYLIMIGVTAVQELLGPAPV